MIKFLRKNYLALFLVLVFVHFILLLNLKFTAWPEMLLWPYLMIKGWLPYADIAIAHTPLMLIKLVIFYKIFGIGIVQLKVFTWILIMILDALVFWLSKKLWNTKVALTTLATFAFWQVFFDGNGLWFDLLMGALALITFYFTKRKSFIWVGIFWALAFASKQTAVWFLIPIGIQMLISRYKTRNIEAFIIGSLLVLIPSVIILWLFKLLPSFYYWAINFGIFVLPKAQGQVQLPDMKNLAISLFPFTIFLPLLLTRKKGSFNLLLWSFAGMMGAYPRFEYFHFQPAVPYLAIVSAIVFMSDWHKKDIIKAFIPIYVIGSLYLFGGFFMRNYNEGTRFYETDVQDVSGYIESNVKSGDKIFVLNYWDNIYALTGTLPATTPWMPQLSWYMDMTGIQAKMVSDLERSKPKLILENPFESIGLGSYRPTLVYDYITRNYKLKEKIDNLNVLIPK